MYDGGDNGGLDYGFQVMDQHRKRQTCKTTNSATESPRSKCSVCQGSRAPPSCEEAQEAEQRQQEMCCCQTLQREGAHCLCAWHWPQPSGAQCCVDQKW